MLLLALLLFIQNGGIVSGQPVLQNSNTPIAGRTCVLINEPAYRYEFVITILSFIFSWIFSRSTSFKLVIYNTHNYSIFLSVFSFIFLYVILFYFILLLSRVVLINFLAIICLN